MNCEERSKKIYVLKAFAILSVICAHMKLPLNMGDAGGIANKFIGVYGTLGVVVFFVCAGYYYHREKGDTICFWKKKIRMIMIPWLLWSIITNLIGNFLKWHTITLQGQCAWTVGLGTWYYFLSVLLICFVVFKFKENKLWFTVLIISSMVSNIFSIMGIWGISDYMTPYLNPLNWFFFFAIGILWKRNEMRIDIGIQRLGGGKCDIIITLIFGIGFCVEMFLENEISNWNISSIFFELIGVLFLIRLGAHLVQIKVFKAIGENTLFIYLVHMQIVGFINTRLPKNAFFFILKPIIGLMMVYAFMWIIIKISRMLRLESLLWVIGIRKNND